MTPAEFKTRRSAYRAYCRDVRLAVAYRDPYSSRVPFQPSCLPTGLAGLPDDHLRAVMGTQSHAAPASCPSHAFINASIRAHARRVIHAAVAAIRAHEATL